MKGKAGKKAVCMSDEQASELVEVIDEKGNVIGLEKRSVVHAKGLRHRVIYLLVFDEQGRVFIQQRSEHKKFMPLKWDLSVGEHLLPKESYEQACVRGAAEELGIKVRNLKFVAKVDFHFEYPSGEIDNESNQFFVWENEGKIRFQDGEVKQGKWVSLKELLAEMREKPELFTPWSLNCREEIEELARAKTRQGKANARLLFLAKNARATGIGKFDREEAHER